MQFSQIPGPTDEIVLKQRRAASLYKNNPHLVLDSTVNTFDGQPLGGDIDPNMPGYEDAPGSKYGMDDISMDNIVNQGREPEEEEEEEVSDEVEPTEVKENFSSESFSFDVKFIYIIVILLIFLILFLMWYFGVFDNITLFEDFEIFE